MERRLHKKIDTYIRGFKKDLSDEIQASPLYGCPDYKEDVMNIINFVYEYNNFELNKEDFMKRKRVKSTIPAYERCGAKRANGEQCTKKRKMIVNFVELIVKEPHMVLLLTMNH